MTLAVVVLAAALGFSPAAAQLAPPPFPVVGVAEHQTANGRWVFARDGAVYAFGASRFFGSMGGRRLNAPIVGGAATPSGQGYWLVAADGGIFSFGDARFFGSTGAIRLNQPIVGMAAHPSGRGYWLFARDGGVFNFGAAGYAGSMGGRRLNAPIVGGTATRLGRGYRMVAADGGIFNFGDARFLGSMGGRRLASPIVGMAEHPHDPQGYWMVAADGGVFNFGASQFHGSAAGRFRNPVAGMATFPGGGYTLVTSRGEVAGFGGRQGPSIPGFAAPLDGVRIRATRVATLSAPLAMATRANDSGLYIAERGGRVRALRGGAVDPVPVLDISARTTTNGERGLLGLTFSRDGARLYVNHTDNAGDTRVAEYRMTGGVADPASRRELLFIDQPFANHNGGDIHLGPDGLLWTALGDGGSANDPQGNAQNRNSLLGKLLRIDPTPSGGRPYTIPSTNPFARGGGRGEIWNFGLRNPWRFSFDRSTGDLWIGDVGQGAREEVDFEPRGTAGGRNYGWDRMEGSLNIEGSPPAGHVLPIHEYPRSGGDCAVVGGYVYRGRAIAGLVGAYVFGDLCSGRVAALRQEGGRVTDLARELTTVPDLVSFGEDNAGELYALSIGGGVFRLSPG